jgi:hypothetical protein
MDGLLAVILGVTLAITSLLLPLSVYPGLVSELGFFAAISSPFWMPAACLLWWAFVDTAREVADLFGQPPARRRWLAPAALVLILNCGLLWWGVPRWLAFLHARPGFEAFIATAPPVYSSGEGFDRRLGVYRVNRLATDPRGGVYFQTRSGPDGFRTSKMTYGFSYRPNQAGSPFGDEKYALLHVVNDWYSFQASRP